jgi:ribonuclease HI
LNGLSDKQQQSRNGKRGRHDLPLFYLYTDGSSSHVTHEGGWAYIIFSEDGFVTQNYGYEILATNNSMELKAAIEGIKFLSNQKCQIELYSDSAYMINSIKNDWWKEWAKNGWKKHNGQVTPNSGFWQELVSLLEINSVEFIKVKAHSGDKLNDYCDKLAKEARKNKGDNLDGYSSTSTQSLFNL